MFYTNRPNERPHLIALERRRCITGIMFDAIINSDTNNTCNTNVAIDIAIASDIYIKIDIRINSHTSTHNGISMNIGIAISRLFLDMILLRAGRSQLNGFTYGALIISYQPYYKILLTHAETIRVVTSPFGTHNKRENSHINLVEL